MKQKLLAASIVVTVLGPTFIDLPGLPRFVRIEDFLIVLCLVLELRQSRRSIHGEVNRVTFRFGLMAVLAVVSIMAGVVAFATVPLLSDWTILPMLGKYWGVFWLTRSLPDSRARLRLLWVLWAAIAVAAFVGICQHFNLLGVNGWLTPHFVDEDNEDVSLEMVVNRIEGARVVGTIGDPRRYGFILVGGIAISLALAITSRRKSTKALCAAGAFIFLPAIIYTLSRSALICLTSTFIGTMLIQSWIGRSKQGVLLLVGVFGLGCAGFFVLLTNSFRDRVFDTENESFDGSYYARRNDLLAPVYQAISNPIIFVTGRGPSKAAIKTASHNDFAWYFWRFGLPGLAFYLLLIIDGLRLGMRNLREAPPSSEGGAVQLASIIWLVNWAVYAMGDSVFKEQKVMPINMLMLGLIYSGTVEFARRPELWRRMRPRIGRSDSPWVGNRGFPNRLRR